MGVPSAESFQLKAGKEDGMEPPMARVLTGDNQKLTTKNQEETPKN